jgi:hypothetical protein
MGDTKPDEAIAETIFHYLLPEGCLHIYGKGGCTADAIVQEATCPLGENGVHQFPEWLDAGEWEAYRRRFEAECGLSCSTICRPPFAP